MLTQTLTYNRRSFKGIDLYFANVYLLQQLVQWFALSRAFYKMLIKHIFLMVSFLLFTTSLENKQKIITIFSTVTIKL